MAINFTASPYLEMIPMVRSEISDLASEEVPIEDLEFTDEEIAKEINLAIILKITRDFGNDHPVIADNLGVSILSDPEYLYPTVIQAALRILQQKRMLAASENIEIRKTGTSISTKALVEGLVKAEESLRQKYIRESLSGSGGIRID